MTGPRTSFDGLAEALERHAARLAKARAAERRGGDAKWRSPRLLWPQFTGES
ncbi:MAG: hypothetical protein K2Y17_01870 [Qipengyuania sp.]|nr:hypothetical protein [Qipengyuania sp.]